MEKIEEPKHYIEGESIGDVYFKALECLVGKNPPHYLTVYISQPFCDTSLRKLPESLNIDDWLEILNVGKIYERFCMFNFSERCKAAEKCVIEEKCKTRKCKTEELSSGKAWVNNRIEALLCPNEEEYFKRLEDQLIMVKERLQVRMHGGSTNALVCCTFSRGDLQRACIHRPNVPEAPCLTMLQFKPKGKELNLFAVFRSQFFDTKAYGNFISLAILLYKMCQSTEYRLGALVSTAHNATFKVLNQKWQKMELYEHLENSGNESLGGSRKS